MLNIKYSGFADEISPDTTQQFEHLLPDGKGGEDNE